MLAFPAGLRIYLGVEAVDMRKQYNGLWAHAAEKLKEDPRQGAVFVFTNKDRDRIKLLYWDGTGVWVMAKRLERGRYTWPIGSTLVHSITDATTAVVETDSYDSVGRKISQQDAGSHITYFAYNFRNQLIEQWGDGALPISYGYDATYGDKITMSTYRGGSGWTGSTWPSSPGTADTTTWTYDAGTALQTAKTDAAGHSVTETYNSRGQNATRTLARGTVTTYSYDSNTGELLGQSYSDSTPSVSYTYNRLGKMATMGDTTGTRTLGYDSTKPWRMNTESLPSYLAERVAFRGGALRVR